MADVLTMLKASESGFIDFPELAEALGHEEALAQVRCLRELSLVDCVNPVWGIDLGEESFYSGSIVHLPDAFDGP